MTEENSLAAAEGAAPTTRKLHSRVQIALDFRTKYEAQLLEAGLVSQVVISDTDLTSGIQVIRMFLGLLQSDRFNLGKLEGYIQGASSLNVLVTSHLAAEVYEKGDFWTGFWKRVDPKVQSRNELTKLSNFWADQYLKSLRQLGLPTFPSLKLTNVGPILMHAGVPTACLNDYFSMLEQCSRTVGKDPNEIISYINSQSERKFSNIDVPAKRFAILGGEFAAEHIERTLELLRTLRETGEISIISLPDRVKLRAEEYVKETNTDSTNSTPTKRKTAQGIIQLILDPMAGNLKVMLPSIQVPISFGPWLVTTDSENFTVPTRQVLGSGEFKIRETEIDITRPTRLINITLPNRIEREQIKLFQETDPLMCFTEEGLLISEDIGLPAGKVWILAPASELESSYQIREVRDDKFDAELFGWEGWNLWRIDLTDTKEICLNSSGRIRRVRSQSQPRIEAGEVITQLTIGGIGILTKRPMVFIPEDSLSDWEIVTTDLDTSRRVLTKTVSNRLNPGQGFDPFAETLSPIIGRYQISVRGPLGRGKDKIISIVEDLEIIPSNQWRLFGEASPAINSEVRFAVPGAKVEAESLQFASEEETKTINFIRGIQEVKATYSLPTMAVSMGTNGLPGKWMHEPIEIDASEIEDHILFVKIPPSFTGAQLKVLKGSEDLQTIDNVSRVPGLAKFQIAAGKDTFAQYRICELRLETHQGMFKVAYVQPRKMMDKILREGNQLRFEGFTGGNVKLRVWSIFEPWQVPQDFHVDAQGIVVLSDEVIGRGTISVCWERIKSWGNSEMERLPKRGMSKVIEIPPNHAVLSSAGTAIAERILDSHALKEKEAWMLLALSGRIGNEYLLPRDTVQPLIKILYKNYEQSIESLGELNLPDSDQLLLTINSAILWKCKVASLPDMEISDETLASAIAQNPMIGMLRAGRYLRKKDSLKKYPEAWVMASEIYGDSVKFILGGKKDKNETGGAFHAAPQLAEMSDDTLRERISDLRVRPQAMLDLDTRIEASLRLFENRQLKALEIVKNNGRYIYSEVLKLLADKKFKSVRNYLESRLPAGANEGWHYLAANSLGFALIARFMAHGLIEESEFFEQNLDNWKNLARYSARMTTIDVVLAECLALASISGDFPKLIKDITDVGGESSDE